VELDAVPSVGGDGDRLSVIVRTAVGHDRVVVGAVPVQDAELSTHTQGLRNGVSHHHMRHVVLADCILEIGIVSTVDISAGPESTQTAQAVEYVVAVPATRHDLERMRSRVRLGGDDGGRSPTLSGRNHAPHTGVGGSFEVGANGAF